LTDCRHIATAEHYQCTNCGEINTVDTYQLELEKRIARLERIVKSGLDFEHPEILDEIKEL